MKDLLQEQQLSKLINRNQLNFKIVFLKIHKSLIIKKNLNSKK